jgi:hypothetical protein
MARCLSFLCAAAAWAAPVADAQAVCAYAGDPYLSPSSGVPLPPEPYLLLLGSDGPARLQAWADHQPVLHDRLRLDEQTQLVQVHTGDASELVIALGDRTYRYPIDTAWQRRDSRVAGRVRRTYDWTCSFHDTIAVAVEGGAIGFEASWGDGAVWLPTFEQLSWVTSAPHHGVLADGRDGPEVVAAPSYALVELGHPNCSEWNVPPELYRAGAAVSLTALHADGTREPLGRIPLASDVEVPAHVAIVDLTPPGLRADPPDEARTGDPRRPMSVALAVALATFLLLRRRRSTFTG